MGIPSSDGRPAAAPQAAWVAVAAAFGTYFCMYAFRKPFTAGTYADLELWGIGYKTVLVVSQVGGYMVSKFIGIKVVSELTPARRAGTLLGLIAAAELALVLFAVTPPPFNAAWLFANGLPLGMVFGIVLGVLEGRRNTEALTAGLCASFVLADGVTKSAGAYLLAAGVPEFWMPAAAGLVFVPPFVGFVWLLSRVPAPSAADAAARGERAPMAAADRRAFFRRYAPGLVLLLGGYLSVTILRSVRADFAPEVWAGLGAGGRPAVFAQSEAVVALVVLLFTGAGAVIRDNRTAFSYSLGLGVAGIGVSVAALLLLRAGAIAPFPFMVLHGVGLYLPYMVVHVSVFERLIAMTRDRGTIAYLMSLADAFGYLGYVAVLAARTAVGEAPNFLSFFLPLSWVVTVLTAAAFVPCWWYFLRHPATRRPAPEAV